MTEKKPKTKKQQLESLEKKLKGLENKKYNLSQKMYDLKQKMSEVVLEIDNLRSSTEEKETDSK